MFEKDFGMYIGDDQKWEAQPAWNPTGDLENLATETGWTPAPATPAPEGTPAPETTPNPEGTPAPETTPNPEGTPPEDTTKLDGNQEGWQNTPEPGSDISWEELQKMLDSLDAGKEVAAEAWKDIQTATEAVQKASSEWDMEALKKANEELTTKVAELLANDVKNQKTIEVLKQEFSKTLNDKISLEYGTANDSKIAQLVNENQDIKNLIAAIMSSWENSKEKIDAAWRNWFQNATWISVDNIISAKKEAETNALWVSEDAWTQVSQGGENLYL